MSDGHVPLEPLPLSDAEREWLAALVLRHRIRTEKRLAEHQAELASVTPGHPEFELRLERVERNTYSIAMADIVAERLNLPPADLH